MKIKAWALTIKAEAELRHWELFHVILGLKVLIWAWAWRQRQKSNRHTAWRSDICPPQLPGLTVLKWTEPVPPMIHLHKSVYGLMRHHTTQTWAQWTISVNGLPARWRANWRSTDGRTPQGLQRISNFLDIFDVLTVLTAAVPELSNMSLWPVGIKLMWHRQWQSDVCLLLSSRKGANM